MENNKRVRGSAILDEGGLFVFTPYNTGCTENNNIQLVKNLPNAALWRGKKSYSIRLKLPLEQFPPLHKIIASIMDLYNEANHDKKQQA